MWRLVALVAVIGCNGTHPDYCEDNVLHYCSSDDHGPYCDTTDCSWSGKTCVETADGASALCVSDSTPNAACAAADGAPRACDGSLLLECEGEYATKTVDCEAAELCDARSRYCLERPGENATCAMLSTDDVPGNSYCDGQVHLACIEQFVVGAWDCGSPELCHLGATGNSACILSTTPDARCPPPRPGGTGFTSFCDDWFYVTCFDGYVSHREDCMNPDEYGGCSLCGH